MPCAALGRRGLTVVGETWFWKVVALELQDGGRLIGRSRPPPHPQPPSGFTLRDRALLLCTFVRWIRLGVSLGVAPRRPARRSAHGCSNTSEPGVARPNTGAPSSDSDDDARPRLRWETPWTSLAGLSWWDSCEGLHRETAADRLVDLAYSREPMSTEAG